jgi:hypothetical protein
MPELNQDTYNEHYKSFLEADVPETLADAASRVMATDDASLPNRGRNDIDIELCFQAAFVAIGNYHDDEEGEE